MKPSDVFSEHRETIRRIVLESGMTNPRLFGSALHGDDIEGSDLDILNDAPPRTSLFEIANLQLALEEHLGIKVDVRSAGALHRAFRQSVLEEAVPV